MRNEHELTEFLTHDISYFERSTFGAIIDLIISRAYISRTCKRCNGLGILDEPFVLRERVVHGRLVPIDPIVIPTGKECPSCHGTGSKPIRRVDTESSTKRQQFETKEAPPDAVLMRYASVSRRLMHMPNLLAAVLVAAYGDEGEAYAETSRGRAWAVTPLTDAGKTLLKHIREAGTRSDDLDPWRAVSAITDIAHLDAANPLGKRTRLLAEASEQSIEMLRAAEAAWEKLIDGERNPVVEDGERSRVVDDSHP